MAGRGSKLVAKYQSSLGWLALQAAMAQEQRKQQQFQQQQAQDSVGQDAQFNRQMQVMEGLRGHADEQHKRDIETARAAGEVAGMRGEAAPKFDGGRLAQEAELAGAGIFEKLRRADTLKQNERDQSMALQDRIDSRSKDNREFQGDLQVGLANLTADRMGDRNLSNEEIARIRADASINSAKIRKSSGGGAKGAGAEKEFFVNPEWGKSAKKITDTYLDTVRARELVANTFNSVSDQDLQAASEYMSRADNAILRLTDRLQKGESLTAEEEDQLNSFVNTNSRLATLFNQMGLARGGKVLTGNEIRRLSLEFPQPNESAVSIRQKLRSAVTSMDDDVRVQRRLAEQGPKAYGMTELHEGVQPGDPSVWDAPPGESGDEVLK